MGPRSSYMVLFILASTCLASAAQVTLQRAVQLAMGHSSAGAIANSNSSRALAYEQELRDAYIPQINFGSNLGYSFGFPLSLEGSAPAILSLNAQSTVWNLAQRDLIRAARKDSEASGAMAKYQRSQIVQQVTSAYLQLAKWQEELSLLNSQKKVSENILVTEQLRVHAGVDSELELRRAKLLPAQSAVQIATAEENICMLQQRLAQMTGLTTKDLDIVPGSIPTLPLPDNPAESPASVSGNPAVAAAAATADASELRARGAHKTAYPTADFAAQYGLIDPAFTDYEKFFARGAFQGNNVTAALVFRIPFNLAQRSHARIEYAEAVRARTEAIQSRERAEADILMLEHEVRRLTAVRDLSQLRFEVSQAEMNATQTRYNNAVGTLRDLQNAVLDASQKTIDRINDEIQLADSQIKLLSLSGRIDEWIASGIVNSPLGSLSHN
ncbi:MAG: TolC family protein [Acidobacteriales bacterium]|nr:TolC family protein [Terriglobales bacterium]